MPNKPRQTPNKSRYIYLWTLAYGAEHEELQEYNGCRIKLDRPLTKTELADYLTKTAEGLDCSLFFAFKNTGNMWRVYKTGEEEAEFDNLFSNAL
jgi:hypothetical protein